MKFIQRGLLIIVAVTNCFFGLVHATSQEFWDVTFKNDTPYTAFIAYRKATLPYEQAIKQSQIRIDPGQDANIYISPFAPSVRFPKGSYGFSIAFVYAPIGAKNVIFDIATFDPFANSSISLSEMLEEEE